ncbi:MAG: hypothetical protein AB8I08_39030, partial [Sandaracinaceae bacterium]
PSDGGPSDGGPPSTCGDGVCQVEDLDVCLAECDLVPTMTGPETPAGRVTTSGDFDLEHPAWHAFDSPAPDVSTMTGAFWLSEENVAPAWVAYDFPDGPHRVLRYGIRYGNGPALVSRAPRHFALEGWNGLEWVTVDTRMDETDWVAGEWRLFDIAGAGTRGFVSYRVIVFDDNDPRLGISTISIGELGLWGI